MATAVTNNPYTALNGPAATTQTQNEAGSADRFLKLLVTQMQNQDPLNPMDNAQITSQMAQINTVNGIETLNGTVKNLNTQFVQMQALQGASLVGHDVTLQGNRLAVADGQAQGGFELAGTADQVKVEVLNAAGRVIDTVQLGAQTAGRHGFEWPATSVADGTELRFRVTATSGAQAVNTTLLMRDTVQAVTTSGGSLVLQTQHSGDVAYGDVKAFN
jgi:flagellar basal-body rod modification protein FlgD